MIAEICNFPQKMYSNAPPTLKSETTLPMKKTQLVCYSGANVCIITLRILTDKMEGEKEEQSREETSERKKERIERNLDKKKQQLQ